MFKGLLPFSNISHIMSEEISAREAFDYATYKQAADKIRQILSAIRNNPASSAKRWVWELMQNAKDIPNDFGKVSIEIELASETELRFKHNGNPFKINNITGLIRQVSSKSSTNEEEGTTGKFGTGFICTHLLSDVIDVKGILEYKGYRSFTLTLDRSGIRSEDLVPRIKNIERVFLEPDLHFPIVDNYKDNRKENAFDTVFIYHLTTNEKFKSAVAGLDDLINTLPITLVSQDKIKQVHVIDRVRNTDVTYVCESVKLDDKVTFSEIKINSDVKQFLSYISNEVALSTEVKRTENGYIIIKRDKKQPVLYRDFPLIGSEEFYFPYTLNGFKLNPTEKRNSIPLNGEDNWEANENRGIIDNAVEVSLKFNEWLINHNASNRYLLAYSPKPKPDAEYDEDVALPWINKLQFDWRTHLLEQELVESKGGIFFKVKDISVPSFPNGVSSEFFSLLDGHYFGRGHLPISEHQEGWLKIINAQPKAWTLHLKYEKDDFLIDLSNAKNVTGLASKINKSREETISWLNKVYKFLIEQNMLNEFDKYAIIPNQKGDFKFLKDLYSDYTSRIPFILKEIYNSVNQDNATVQHLLIDADIDAIVFGNTLRTFSMKEMNDKLNEYVKSGNSINKNGSNISVGPTVAYKIISLYPRTEDNGFLNKRRRMYDFSSSYRLMDGYTEIDTSDFSLWKEADYYWFTNSYHGIESKKDIGNFSKSFFLQEKTEEDAISWLNEYLQFYRDNSFGDFIKEKSVFPRQLSDNSENGKFTFLKLANLRYDNNVPESFKNLGAYAKDISYKYDYCRQFLLHRSIRGYENHQPFSVKDVYEYVKKRFDESNDEAREVIARHTISILAKHENPYTEENKLYNFSKTISDKTFGEVSYVDSHSGFYWGFAQEFYIKYICKRIAESINVNGFKKLNPYFANMHTTELTTWIDSLIEFLHSYKDKTYWPIITDQEKGYGIWLNQHNDFCRFQDVREDSGIPEELKNLAANNPNINIDYREVLLSNHSSSVHYLQTTSVSIAEIGENIDNKVSDYVGDKQKQEFRELIFSLNKLTQSIPELRDAMSKFKEKKDSLIVGSLGEGETMGLISSLVQQGDDKLIAVKELLENNSTEDLKNITSDLTTLKSTNEELRNENERLLKIIDDLKSGKSVEINTVDSDASKRQMNEAQLEAQRKLIESRPDWKFPEGYGQCDENGVPCCYSTETVKDENGKDLPIVLKSYKSKQSPFKINPIEWESVVKDGARLFVYTLANGILDIVEIDQEDLVMNQSNISITFNSENLDKEQFSERITAFAETLHYFKELHFNFDRFHIKADAVSVKNIHSKHIGSQDSFSDKDI